MITTLAFRHLLVRKLRSLFLLLGFSIGVGVMIVLLSVGEAMLDQSRDVSLVGGGELTILPQGIDVEAMRTGGLSGMYFGIDRARYLTRQAVGGPRHAGLVSTVSPVIEGKLLYLRHGDRTLAVRAGGEIPSRAATLGSGLDVRSGSWHDTPADSAYIAPTRQQLYDELDRFHLPVRPDSSWGEWHYLNIVPREDEWWYVTYLVGGEVPHGKWGGRLLVTHRRSDGKYERFDLPFAPGRVQLDTTRADLTLGDSWVRQRDGRYRLRARGGQLRIDVDLIPAPNHYFPPVELSSDDFLSGYVVPALTATASGRICVGSRCQRFNGAPAYHDHNWGVWRDVTWEWGAARGDRLSLLYGGVYGPQSRQGSETGNVRSPFFLTLVDSLGMKQVLRFSRIHYAGSRTASGRAGTRAPQRFRLVATREADTVSLSVRVIDALATEMTLSTVKRVFLQMRGRFKLTGRLGGQVVADSGSGFFETYVPR
ncbi:MAG TPA: hypothetical protein VFU40_12600 [Gemmatimonadales bacterium]|nr:hypothetical protein [Gemmatimonadales bacterium]